MKTEILTDKELYSLIYEGKKLKPQYINVYDDFVFFVPACLKTKSKNEEFLNSLRFVVCYDEQNLYGLMKYAKKDGKYCLYYISVNVNFRSQGVSKMLLNKFIEEYSKNFKQYELNTTEFTNDGWNYVRNNLKEKCNENGIVFIDNVLKDETIG